MHKVLEAICQSLDSLSSFVKSSSTEDRSLREALGWNLPAVTRHDLAALPASLASRIREVNPEELDDEFIERFEDVPRQLTLLQTETIPYMFSGNGGQAIPAFMTTMGWLTTALEPLLGWQTIQDNKAMPPQLARRIRNTQAALDAIAPEMEQLQEKIRLIQEAYETAESLPADLQTLKEARSTISRLSIESAELNGKIGEHNKKAEESLEAINSRQEEADKLVQQCEEAYRITTTRGLAAAFDERAKSLNYSMWYWVAGLLTALSLGTWLGARRVGLLSELIAQKESQWGVIWMHIALSVFSVGAPVWFAWIATKQIGQRFRLAEDYGFKAAVAKAYEGYRREAARIDKDFEARLFSSALTRLEEAPLRLVENTVHGSPWHELLSSKISSNKKKIPTKAPEGKTIEEEDE